MTRSMGKTTDNLEEEGTLPSRTKREEGKKLRKSHGQERKKKRLSQKKKKPGYVYARRADEERGDSTKKKKARIQPRWKEASPASEKRQTLQRGK